MAEIIPFEAADFKAALRKIRELWEEGEVTILPHARVRMEQRGIDELDIQNIIRTGQVTQQTLSRFTVAGKTVEEKSASCVVEIKKNLLVITVTPPGKKPKKRR